MTKISEIESMKVFGFVCVIICHFWVIYSLPTFLGHPNYVVGMGINACQIQQIGISQYFPEFINNKIILTTINIIASNGYQGVGIFFILSGFGLTISQYNKNKKLAEYLFSRFERIYLQMWVTYALFYIAFYTYGSKLNFTLRSFILLDQGLDYTWFLFPLLQFYLLFPFIYKYFSKVKNKTKLYFTIAITLFIYSYLILHIGYNYYPPILSKGACPPSGIILFRLAEPIYGILLAFYYLENRNRYESLFSINKAPLWFIIYAGSCALSLTESNIIFKNTTYPIGQSICNILISVSLFNLIYTIVKNFKLVGKHINRISELSFEFYLCQSLTFLMLSNLTKKPSVINLFYQISFVLIINIILSVILKKLNNFLLAVGYYKAKIKILSICK